MTPPRRGRQGRKAGSVYLVASSQQTTFAAMAKRVLATIPHRPARVAVSHAAAEGPMLDRVNGALAHVFGGAEVTRFTVEGEKHPMAPEWARGIIDDADLVFISGGDPVRGARLLAAAGADEWLREARAGGTPCMGLSAGAIMLGAWWADWPDDAPRDAPHDGGELVACSRVVPDLVVDCHAEGDHWSELELVRGMLDDRLGDTSAGMPRLLGLPTGTGIIVAPDGSVEAPFGAPFRLR